MSQRSRSPLSRRIQARAMRVINVPMRRVLALPVETPLSKRLMLARITGRRTGRVYRQPLSYVQQGTTLLTPGGGKWKLNLRDDQPVPIRLRGRDVIARPELVSDTAEIERLVGEMAASNPMVSSFVGIPKGADGRLDQQRLRAAVQHGFRVVRWHLDAPFSAGFGGPAQRADARASSTVSSAAGSASRRSSGIGSPLRTDRP
jgi:hypothetical protein